VTTPLGPVTLSARDGALVGVAWTDGSAVRRACCGSAADAEVLRDSERQLNEYFAGHRRGFDVPLDLSACPPFTLRVLTALRAVPFGTTLSYGELAARAGAPRAARAVGRAMAANPLPIVIPCHRVLAANGQLGGYSGGEGVPTKEWLLAFERDSRE
jgi:methylated-DNA-[protein]-cysteine S-methyltransferase